MIFPVSLTVLAVPILLLSTCDAATFQLGSIPRLLDQGGWGPNELNESNGGSEPGDGGPLKINGVVYDHGIGTHAISVISFDLQEKCSSFSSWVGIDDEVGDQGSCVFKVFADGSLLYESPRLTALDAASFTGSLDVSDVSELMLIVEEGGDGPGWDHANWAEPEVDCTSRPNGNGNSVKHIRGSWGPVLNWPVKAIHASLLPSWHIISHASQQPDWVGDNDPDAPHDATKIDLSDIATWGHQWVDHPTEELYCSGHTLLKDGSLFEFGGHGGANPDYLFYGQDQASRFDFATKSWIQLEDMKQARWYATGVTLGNGDVLAIGGSHAGGNLFIPEVFNGKSWRLLPGVNYEDRLNNNDFIFDHTYPFVHLASDGRVLWAGWDEVMAYINTKGDGSWSADYPRESIQRAWGAPVLYRVDKLILVGGIDHQGTGGFATQSVSHIDFTGGKKPVVTRKKPMMFYRADADGTILANGDVFVNGGGYNHILGPHPTHLYVPETWNPDTNTWTLGAQATFTRGYHSASLLLPDGRVWTGGGECGVDCTDGMTAQVYTPPYLYRKNGSGSLAPRPTIVNVGQKISYGRTFNVDISSSSSIQKVTLIRLGSTTHHLDFEQRYLELDYSTAGSGTRLVVSAPAHGNLAPPGYYMLFIIDANGVPSVAKMVQLDTPPDDGGDDPEVFQENFNSNNGGFNYKDSIFRGATLGAAYAHGWRKGDGGIDGNGGLRVRLGGVDANAAEDISGGFTKTYTLAEAADVVVEFTYQIFFHQKYNDGEYSEVLFAFDGKLYGITGGVDYVERVNGVSGSSNVDRYTSEWTTVSIDVGRRSAGTHTVGIGGHNNMKPNHKNGKTTIDFDNVKLTATP